MLFCREGLTLESMVRKAGDNLLAFFTTWLNPAAREQEIATAPVHRSLGGAQLVRARSFYSSGHGAYLTSIGLHDLAVGHLVGCIAVGMVDPNIV